MRRDHTTLRFAPVCMLRRIIQSSRVPVDAWKLAPRGRLAFLQRWAWAFLKRTHALEQHTETDFAYRRVEIDHAQLLDRIFASKRSLFEEHLEPTHVLIGSDDFDELMNMPAMAREFARFDVHAPMGRNGRMQLLGMTFHVLPWMQGCVVLPKDW